MEETNYYRPVNPYISGNRGELAELQSSTADNDDSQEGIHRLNELKGPAQVLTDESHSKEKKYLQKLKLFDKGIPSHPNRIQGMVLRPLIFLSFPVILYAGFCYGSNLVWFNVLNGTASLVLSKQPYAFSSSMVGLSYLSSLFGATLG